MENAGSACQSMWENRYEGWQTDMALSKGDDLMRECLAQYGWEREMLMLAEECSELIQASTKLQRVVASGTGCESALDHLAEEMADVRIMLSQMSVMFGLDADVAKWVEHKLRRTRGRLEERDSQEMGEGRRDVAFLLKKASVDMPATAGYRRQQDRLPRVFRPARYKPQNQ